MRPARASPSTGGASALSRAIFSLNQLGLRRMDILGASGVIERCSHVPKRLGFSKSSGIAQWAIRTYCLEHLAAAGKIPSAHAADLIVFIQALRAKGDCQAQYGGFCDADGHDTEDLLVWGSTGKGDTLCN